MKKKSPREDIIEYFKSNWNGELHIINDQDRYWDKLRLALGDIDAEMFLRTEIERQRRSPEPVGKQLSLEEVGTWIDRIQATRKRVEEDQKLTQPDNPWLISPEEQSEFLFY